MRTRLIAVLLSFVFTSPAIASSQIEDWELKYWKDKFKRCGYYTQVVNSVPQLSLEDEYQHLQNDMIENAVSSGASGDQIEALLAAFDAGRNDALEDGWQGERIKEEVTEEGLRESIAGMRRIRDSCGEYGTD